MKTFLPIWNVCVSMHSGNINHRIKGCTSLIEILIDEQMKVERKIVKLIFMTHWKLADQVSY